MSLTKMHRMFQEVSPDNVKNSKYIILGSSGSGKTTLMHILIGYEMRKHRRIIFLEGGKNILLDQLEPIYKEANIEIVRYTLNNSNVIEKLRELENLIDKETKENSMLYTLICIDDISHLMKDSSKLQSFLTKVYTTSRQALYDCICILHSLKMGNVVMRNNCDKIFITSTDQQYIDEFKNIIVSVDEYPIIIDCNTNPHSQIKLDLSSFSNITLQQFIARIGLTNPNSYPRIVRSEKRRTGKYISVNNPDFEIFQTKIPKNFYNNLRTGKKKLEQNKTQTSSPQTATILEDRAKITNGENNAVGIKQSSGGSLNWDLLYNYKKNSRYLK